MFSDYDDWELSPPAPKTIVRKPHPYDVNQRIKDHINRGEFHAIPSNKKSQPFFLENPWPPRQFICGRCGYTYDGLVPRHPCGDNSSYHSDEFVNDFCTHCGNHFNPYDGRHRCEPYGRHCRTTNPDPKTYYVRVWGNFQSGKHHFDSYDVPIQYIWVECLTGPSGFRHIGTATGIERAKLVIGKLPDAFGLQSPSIPKVFA